MNGYQHLVTYPPSAVNKWLTCCVMKAAQILRSWDLRNVMDLVLVIFSMCEQIISWSAGRDGNGTVLYLPLAWSCDGQIPRWCASYGHGSKSKSYPPVNIPIPTKID